MSRSSATLIEPLMMVSDDLRKKADEMLEQWAREYATERAGDFSSVNLLDGDFAMAIGGRTRSLKNRIAAKETRRSPTTRIPEFKATLMDEIMFAIKKVHSDYFHALKEYYLRGTIKAVAKELNWSETKAKQVKSAAFDMVVLMLEERGS